MPIYEYACEACDHRFESWQKISDPAIEVCPSCGQPRARRLISLSSFSLKGTGWYVTDYKRSGSGSGGEKSGDKADKPATKAA